MPASLLKRLVHLRTQLPRYRLLSSLRDAAVALGLLGPEKVFKKHRFIAKLSSPCGSFLSSEDHTFQSGQLGPEETVSKHVWLILNTFLKSAATSEIHLFSAHQFSNRVTAVVSKAPLLGLQSIHHL